MSRRLPDQNRVRLLRALALGVLAFVLTGCGGSSGGAETGANPPPPSSGPTAEDLQNARNATLQLTLVAANNELIVSWIDTFGNERGYGVERRVQSGPWEMLELLPATPGTGLNYRWGRVIDSPAVYRVVALRDGYSVALQGASGKSEVAVGPSTTLQIQVDEPEPLRQSVQVTVDGAATAKAVHYFVDTRQIGNSATAPTFAVTWDSSTVPDGDHLLQAQVELAEGSLVELRRVVVTDNLNVSVSLDVTESDGRIRLRASASSEAGITSVEFLRDGTSLAVVNGPNDGSYYTHSVEKSGLPAGPTVFKAIATDAALEKDEAAVQYVIEHPAFLTLSTPVNGAIVSGTLLLEGVFGDDEPGATLSIALGDIDIARPTASPFSTSYPLAGLPGGDYTLITTLKDAAGHSQVKYQQLIVSTQYAYDLIAADVGQYAAIDTENSALLYQRPDDKFVVRSPAGDETQLQIPASALASELNAVSQYWQLDSGRAAMATNRTEQDVYVFERDGTARRVTEEIALPSDYSNGPLLRWPWVVWNVRGENRIYNLETRALHRVPLSALDGADYAFAGASGAERLVFSRTTADPERNLFAYDLSAQTTVAVTSGASNPHAVQGDATRVAWRSLPGGGGGAPFQLVVGAATNPASSSVVSSAADKFYLEDGLLAWTETTAGVRMLKADDGSATTTISSASSVALYSASGRHVIFSENGKLYVWSAALGRRVLLDVLPNHVIQRHGVAFVVTGKCLMQWWVCTNVNVNSIHRVSLP